MPSKVTEKEFKRRIATAQNIAVKQRNYRRARDRALAKLAQRYKEEYLELLEQEKKADEQEGKGWSTLADNLPDYWTITTEQDTDTDRGDTSTNPQDESHQV